MDANTYANIENGMMVSTLLLTLMIVWVAMQLIKSKARFVHQLTITLLEVI